MIIAVEGFRHRELRDSKFWGTVKAVGNEGQGDDMGRQRSAAHQKRERRSRRGKGRRDIAHGDRAAKRGRKASRGDDPDDLAARIGDFRALARRGLAVQRQPDAPAGDALGQFALDPRGAGKAAFGAAALSSRRTIAR